MVTCHRGQQGRECEEVDSSVHFSSRVKDQSRGPVPGFARWSLVTLREAFQESWPGGAPDSRGSRQGARTLRKSDWDRPQGRD